jgi:hypothetical protein
MTNDPIEPEPQCSGFFLNKGPDFLKFHKKLRREQNTID